MSLNLFIYLHFDFFFFFFLSSAEIAAWSCIRQGKQSRSPLNIHEMRTLHFSTEKRYTKDARKAEQHKQTNNCKYACIYNTLIKLIKFVKSSFGTKLF